MRLGLRSSGWAFPISFLAEFGATPAEKYYFVLDGEITVKTEKEEITLGSWDSVYIAPNEGRSILNKTNKPVSMLVVVLPE
jgi:quercetin dioxygenase-like cupin family protein